MAVAGITSGKPAAALRARFITAVTAVVMFEVGEFTGHGAAVANRGGVRLRRAIRSGWLLCRAVAERSQFRE